MDPSLVGHDGRHGSTPSFDHVCNGATLRAGVRGRRKHAAAVKVDDIGVETPVASRRKSGVSLPHFASAGFPEQQAR